ncbi:MAG: FAD:protein transferase [Baekduia sp.]|nr:FAD:protein transferase [Baekduia sp.]
MGTTVSIDVRSHASAAAPVARALAWLHEVDATYSTYRADSVISRLRRAELARRDAPPQVRDVLARCELLRAATGGWFDARVDREDLDPSALVKGWAVQCAADLLTAAGLTDFCLSAGGDVVARGAALPAAHWRVGVQHPCDRYAIAAVLEARDLAVATSGAYERGAHIVDPHTGTPPHGVASVTVVGPDLGTADAYSTAAFAMGLDGPGWTLRLDGYEAMTILEDQTVLCTPAFPTLAPAS